MLQQLVYILREIPFATLLLLRSYEDNMKIY